MRILASGVVALAAVVGIVPQFTECLHEGTVMKCHWTAQASLALAVPLALLGGMVAFGRSRQAQRSLGIIGAVLGIFVILLPTQLIGVCASDTMRCNIIMKPTLILAGLIATALSLGIIFARGERRINPR